MERLIQAALLMRSSYAVFSTAEAISGESLRVIEKVLLVFGGLVFVFMPFQPVKPGCVDTRRRGKGIYTSTKVGP
jgi:hypothetical protein